MRKIIFNKKIFLFLIALVGYTEMNAQSCGSPISLTPNTGFTAKDSTNLALTYYKFTATNTQHSVKFYIKNVSLPFFTAAINTFSYNCGSLASSGITSYKNINGDTIYIDMPSLTVGGKYLLELTNVFTNSNLVNRISIGNKLFGITTQTFTCPTSSLACQSSTPCDYVCNGDFECVQTPLTAYPYLDQLYNWSSFCGQGYYYSTLTPTPNIYGYNAPCNWFGYQNAYSGNTYVGLAYVSNSFPNWAQDLQTKLTTPLSAGGVYQISFYCSKSELSNLVFSKIGIWLTNSPITNIGYPYATSQTTLTPSAIETNTALLNDYTNWQKITMTYTSVSGGEQYLTIGFPVTTPTVQTSASSSTCTGMGTNVNNLATLTLYIDKVSLVPSLNITTSASPASICSGANSILTATNPNPLTYTWSPGSITGNSISVTPNITTIYTVTGSYLGCSQTNTVQVNVGAAPFTFTPTISSNSICLNATTNVTLSGNYTGSPSFVWQPGNLTTLTQVVSPTVSTIYSLTASSATCAVTKTISLAVQAACCTSTVPALTSTSLTGVTLNGPQVINFDLTIYGNNIPTVFQNGEFLMAPNVKITVLGTVGDFILKGAHLYACSTTMWKGIDILDGSRMVSVSSATTGNSTLIEDAITAVNLNNVTAAAPTLPIEMTNTIFNKNYVAINISNASVNTFSVLLDQDVFTSRTLTFTPTSWPSTSTSGLGLRAATNPTTGLAVPYLLQSAPISLLKNPYTLQSSHIGVQLNNVGNTVGSNYYGVEIGVTTQAGASDFNLFDALAFGIDATNSNVSSVNNVYQNTQQVTEVRGGPRYYYVTVGGSAIRTTITNYLNANLNMTAIGTNSTSYSLGNRFWDCYIGVEATNLYNLDCKYATFRSTQASTAAISNPFLPGNKGIINSTNRFYHNVRYNNFNNINTPISVMVAPGTYTYGANTSSGILAGNLFIDYNYFGAQLTDATLLGNAYLNTAVYLSSTSTTGWLNVSTLGMRVANNTVNRAFRGISVDAFAHPSSVQSNLVSLLDDNVYAATQQGIHAGNTPNIVITTNSLNAVNTTNTLVTLVYTGASPASAVTCNTLNTSYQAFEFNSSNGNSTWKGNSMTTHARGLVLSNNGKIGTQGNVGVPSDNTWNASWAGTNGTYIDATSDAANSKLWVKSTGVWVPQTPGFPIGYSAFSYQVAANTPTTTGSYSCGTIPPPSMMVSQLSTTTSTAPTLLSASSATLSTENQYIANNSTYRYLDANPSVKNSNTNYVNFYNAQTNTSIDKFKQTEAGLSSGQITQAQAINNAISPVNAVEVNYKTYYTLYANYKNANFSAADSNALINLAKLCPGNDGAIVYQARALYNLIYKTVKVLKENCSSAIISGGRLMSSASATETLKNSWSVDLFPNPTRGNFTLVSKLESEALNLTITDLAGKLIYSNTVNTSNFIANLELNAKQGVYLIIIKNSTHESITKKLVIAD